LFGTGQRRFPLIRTPTMALKSAPLFELISNAIKEDGKSFVSKVNGVIQVCPD
jgi:hypothetical protein